MVNNTNTSFVGDFPNSTEVLTTKMQCIESGYYIYWKHYERVLNEVFKIYLCGATIIIGLITNSLSLVVLAKLRRTTTHLLLMALSVADSLVLVAYSFSQVYYGVFQKYNLLKKEGGFFFPVSVYVFTARKVFETCSLYLPVLVAIERYLAVCHPFKVKQWWSRKNTVIAIICVVLLAMALNLSFPWEVKIIYKYDPCTKKIWPVRGTDSEMAKSKEFRLSYRLVILPLFKLLLPLVVLLILNIRIIVTLKRAKRFRSAMTQTGISKDDKQNNITIMVVAIVGVLIICQTPISIRNGIISALFVVYPALRRNKQFYQFYLDAYWPCFWLVSVNSAVNFFIYVAANPEFRKTLCQLCACARKTNETNSRIDKTCSVNQITIDSQI